MAIRILLTGVLILALGIETTTAREWVSRDGRFTVEAELLSVDAEQVVLRREDGSVIRVPQERLSLGDVKYVQEAMQAAGIGPAADASPGVGTVAPGQAPKAASSRPSGRASAQGPPLAQQGVTQWQAAPDPPEQEYRLKPGAKVEVSVSVRYSHSRPFVMFPSSSSSFVLLGSEEHRGPRQLWDLRKKRVVGEIDAEIGVRDKVTVSQDGRYLAYYNYQTRGAVQVRSFPGGKEVQSLKLPTPHSIVMFLGFAGPQRIIVGESSESNYLVYDVETGRQCGIIQAKPASDENSQAISPGGNYLAVFGGLTRPMMIYDTRNGVCAGSLKTESQTYPSSLCTVFSPDGEELLTAVREGGGIALQAWSMTDGSVTVTHRFKEDPARKLGHVQYGGGLFQWLGDRSGWLFEGVAVIDRESGKIVWQDREAISANNVLPRRIVDADRMLVFRAGEKEKTLHLVSIPKDEIEESREVVSAGGTPADSGLPPLTPIKMQGAEDIVLAHAAWGYRCSASELPPKALGRNRLRLGSGAFDITRTFFSRPDVARVAMGRRVEDGGSSWKTPGLLPQACHLYDLQTGEQVTQFDVPFPTEFIDLSPNGKLGLFRIDRTKDRLDIFDLENNQHMLGFRPFSQPRNSDNEIGWAGFVDESHVITVSQSGRIIGWQLPECKAIYQSERGVYRAAGRTRDRRTMVVMSGNTPHFVDALTGKLTGTLPDIPGKKAVVLPHASFSADEKRLAVLSTCDEGCLLAAWDLTNGSLLMKAELPYYTFGLFWCGPDHVLLNRSSGSKDPDTLVDVERGMAVWDYATVSGSALRSSPDQRGWFYSRGRMAAPGELVAVELPGNEVRSLLARVEPPAPLIGPGAAVTVQMQIDKLPQTIPPGWPDLEDLDRGLQQHFTRQLQERRAEVVARGNVRVVVGIKREKLEETMSVGGLFGPSREFLVTATLLIPYVAVVDSGGNRIWLSRPSHGDMERVDLGDCPQGMNKETFIELKQWETAARWLRSVEIPYPLFHPGAHRGFGDSTITPEGAKIQRSPTPAQMKAQNKTACVSARILLQWG